MEKPKKYELMVILKAQLPENVRMGIESKIIEKLEASDGKVGKVDVWGKKHLAYKIRKHNEGYYIVYEFENSPKEIESIEKSLKLNKDVLRYLVTATDR
jgi:small subunit ribosomal protein S6